MSILDKRVKDRAEVTELADAILTRAEKNENGLTDEDRAKLTEYRATAESLDREIEEIEATFASSSKLRLIQERQAAADTLQLRHRSRAPDE